MYLMVKSILSDSPIRIWLRGKRDIGEDLKFLDFS